MTGVVMLGALALNVGAAMPVAHAQGATSGQYQVLAPLPCVESSNFKCASNADITVQNGLATGLSFKGYIQYLFNLLIALAAVAAVFMIVWGGFTYMSTDSFYKKEEGLEKVRHAVYGLLLVLCSFLILRTVDPRLTQVSDTLVPPLQLKQSDGTDLLNALNGSVAAYDAHNAALQAQEAAAAAQTIAAQNQLSSINQQIYDNGCDQTIPGVDPLCDNLYAQEESLQNQIASSTAQTMVAATQQAFNSYVAQNKRDPSSISVQSIADDITNLKITYINETKKLNELNAGDQVQVLKSSYQSALGQLEVQQAMVVESHTGLYSSVGDVNTAVSTLVNIRDSILPQITDPVQQAQLKQAINAAAQQLNTGAAVNGQKNITDLINSTK